jgi:hypothetical protein
MNKIINIIKNYVILDGGLRTPVIILFIIVGGGIALLDVYRWNTGWVYMVGMAVAAVGGYSAQAFLVGERPFENKPYPKDWLKNRKKDD